MNLFMTFFRDLNELFKEFEHDLEKVNAEMALLKEKNKKKGENVEVDPNEFSLQQDMSLLPGFFLFFLIFSYFFFF